MPEQILRRHETKVKLSAALIHMSLKACRAKESLAALFDGRGQLIYHA